MPRNQYGEYAEAIVNPLGVIGRMNLGQLFCHDLNFRSDCRVREMKATDDYNEKARILFEFINDVNPYQCNMQVEFFNNLTVEERMQFIDEIIEFGIPIHQAPFFDNLDIFDLERLKRKYKDDRYEMWMGDYKIHNNLVMADMYMVCLKHHPATKFSARGTGNTNIKNVPTKGKDHKDNTQPYSTSAVRLGNMELNNMAMADPVTVKDMFERYSTAPALRGKVIHRILNQMEPTQSTASNTSEIIKVVRMLYRTIGLEMDNTPSEEYAQRAKKQVTLYKKVREYKDKVVNGFNKVKEFFTKK